MKFMADTKVADSKRAFEMQKAAFSQEINVKVRGGILGAREREEERGPKGCPSRRKAGCVG